MNEEYKKLIHKIGQMSESEKIKRDLYLRKQALENIKLTGYPSIDKIWLKYYNEENIISELPKNLTVADYFEMKTSHDLDYIVIDALDGKYTNREFRNLYHQTARALYASWLNKGKVIMSVLPPTALESILFYGVSLVGVALSGLAPFSTTDEICNSINKINVEMLFIFDNLLDKKREKEIYARTNISNIVVLGYNPCKNYDARTIAWEEFIKRGRNVELPKIEINSNDTLYIAQTGGTTGTPKNVKLSNACFNNVVHCLLNSELNYNKYDVWLRLYPLFSASAAVANNHLPLCSGMTSIVKFLPEKMEEFDQMLMDIKPNHCVFIPPLFDALENSQNLNGVDLSFLKGISIGGLGLTETFENRVKNFCKLHNINDFLGYAYGCTENTTSAAIRSSFATSTIGTSGAPLTKTIVAAFDKDMQEKMYGEKGELCIHSPNLMLGYYGDELATKNSLKIHDDGLLWLHTGDIGSIGTDGLVTCDGRMTRVISTYPVDKVYPEGLENMISKIPGVLEIAVGQTPDTEHPGFFIPVYFFIPDFRYDGNYVKKSIEELSKTFANNARPKDIIICDHFPMTKVGKPDIIALEKNYEQNFTLARKKLF